MKKIIIILYLIPIVLLSQIPDTRVVAEWEPALGTMIRWPLGIPSDLVVELASDDILYVLVETNNQQNQAINSFNNWGVNSENVIFITTETYSHWTRDHGPQFVIGQDYWKVINQQFDGYPVENGCDYDQEICDESMILYDCDGNEFCNNQPEYASEGYDCYINNELCEDFNGDGQIMDWLGDGYCDNGNWGLDFMCDTYSWDCGDCGEIVSDENNYCDNGVFSGNRNHSEGRPMPSTSRGWEEDDQTNIDFANQLEWDVLDIPIFWTGGNFMTDGYGMGFSTKLMINENNMTENQFLNIVEDYLNMDIYHILDNPNEESIQHIDCLAKLVNPETIIIKQVSESSSEYECMEQFADSFYELNTFYGRPFEIYRLFCPEINGGSWETNPVAAYTNSLILNGKVLVPQYGIPQDNQAIETYQMAMPGYEVIGFDDSFGNPWYAEDALHCRTMGVFNPNMVHISHKSVRSEDVSNNANINIEAEVINYNSDSYISSVVLNWKYSAEDGPFSEIELNMEEGNIYSGIFPLINPSSEIEYYISVTNSNSENFYNPNAGWHTFISLDTMLGDVNSDGSINIQDIILSVNLILSDEYSSAADLNFDNSIDVLDIVQILNLILGS